MAFWKAKSIALYIYRKNQEKWGTRFIFVYYAEMKLIHKEKNYLKNAVISTKKMIHF